MLGLRTPAYLCGGQKQPIAVVAGEEFLSPPPTLPLHPHCRHLPNHVGKSGSSLDASPRHPAIRLVLPQWPHLTCDAAEAPGALLLGSPGQSHQVRVFCFSAVDSQGHLLNLQVPLGSFPTQTAGPLWSSVLCTCTQSLCRPDSQKGWPIFILRDVPRTGGAGVCKCLRGKSPCVTGAPQLRGRGGPTKTGVSPGLAWPSFSLPSLYPCIPAPPGCP